MPVGTVVEVRLPGTSWQFASPPGAVLRPNRMAQRQRQRGDCLPGEACETTSWRLTVTGRGSGSVTAARDICGEMVQCAPEQRHVELTVTGV